MMRNKANQSRTRGVWRPAAGLAMLAVLPVLAAGTAGEPAVRIYLPREAVVQDVQITLGGVAIVRGEGAEATVAAETALGRFVTPGQEIVLDQHTIRSRLASRGLEAGDVEIRGAEKVTVKRDGKAVKAGAVLEAARRFLLEQAQAKQACAIEVLREPKEWPMSRDAEPVQLRPRMSGAVTGGTAKVYVDVVRNGVVLGTREVLFVLKYLRHRVIALQDIAAGTVLTSQNVQVQTVESQNPDPPGWEIPFGQVTLHPIRKGAEVATTATQPAESPVVITRRQAVVVKLETPLLSITAIGEALSDGKVGEFIRVRMGASRDARVITARVQADGTLEPYYEGRTQ